MMVRFWGSHKCEHLTCRAWFNDLSAVFILIWRHNKLKVKTDSQIEREREILSYMHCCTLWLHVPALFYSLPLHCPFRTVVVARFFHQHDDWRERSGQPWPDFPFAKNCHGCGEKRGNWWQFTNNSNNNTERYKIANQVANNKLHSDDGSITTLDLCAVVLYSKTRKPADGECRPTLANKDAVGMDVA